MHQLKWHVSDVSKFRLIFEIFGAEIAVEDNAAQVNSQRFLPHEFRADGERYEHAVHGAEVPELDCARGPIR